MTSLASMNASDETDAPLPERVVSADEFRTAATSVGWQLKSIELFLKKPVLREFVQVGHELLKVKP